MYLWNRNYARMERVHHARARSEMHLEAISCMNDTTPVVWKSRTAEWIIPRCVAVHKKYNPRHVPVVIKEGDNEYHYLRQAIHRVRRGWVHGNATLPNPWGV